jgi:hypothetical protein
MSDGKLRRALPRRRTAVFAAAGIAVAAVSALMALPSGASVGPGGAIPVSAIPALRTSMFLLARYDGDAHPASIRAVFTTQDKALRTATPGDLIPGSAGRPVYLVVMTGDFKDTHFPTPPGARLPTGRYLTVTVNPATFRVMDVGIGNHRPPVPLRSYGPVSNLLTRK